MCGERVVIVSHHDYASRCTARRGCVHSRRNLVLVVQPDRAGQHGARHRCLGWVSLASGSTIGARPRLGLPQHYMDSMSETYLRETMEGLIQSESPRLYREYWTACPLADNDDDSAPPPDDPAFAKTGGAS